MTSGRHASQQGVQGVGVGSKVSHALVVLPTKFGEKWISISMLRYLHFLAKIAYFAICICNHEHNGSNNSEIIYSWQGR